MIGTEFLYGQGFGNQLFCYVTARSATLDKNCQFGTVGQDLFGAPRWNKKGPYFMDIDLGVESVTEEFSNIYYEKSDRYYMSHCYHDAVHGCDVSEFDRELTNIPNGTLIYGNLQAEQYFIHRKDEIKKWLAVKPEYDSYEFCHDDLCIINMRGGEYTRVRELYLGKRYWLDAMAVMKALNPKMRFLIITDDVVAANKLMPEIDAKHFDLAKDYVSIKNARYLILSNSSFAFFPVFTSETVKFVIAPKYWARHNVSDGYWGSAQNIYSGWNYLDRADEIFTSNQCVAEFNEYKEKTGLYSLTNKPLNPGFLNRTILRVRNRLL